MPRSLNQISAPAFGQGGGRRKRRFLNSPPEYDNDSLSGRSKPSSPDQKIGQGGRAEDTQAPKDPVAPKYTRRKCFNSLISSGGRSHLPADLHIDSGIDLGALLSERAPRPRGDTRHQPAEAMTPL